MNRAEYFAPTRHYDDNFTAGTVTVRFCAACTSDADRKRVMALLVIAEVETFDDLADADLQAAHADLDRMRDAHRTCSTFYPQMVTRSF